MNSKLLGSWGEEQAVRYLRKNGYKIVGMNYKNRFGEIDIIAENKNVIVFAEVKTRKSSAFAEAKEFVDYRKISRIVTVAEMWLSENQRELQPRFDVIEVYAPDGTDTVRPEINHIENAFGA